jgi:uncharacterized alkaline shock family protein YloU
LYILGFVGPSGTGKSHRALWVAKERGISFIIDDGLLIEEHNIIAGESAKKEKTKIGSVKRALFTFDEHATVVSDALKKHKVEKLMILGTSEGMVDKIANRLGYPGVDEKLYITEVAKDFEIEKALETRQEQGKHVVPVPTFNIKKDFSGYLLDPLQIFQRKGHLKYDHVGEKSVVRPAFSYLGSYTISDYAIYQIVNFITNRINGIKKITRFRADNRPEGIIIDMDLTIIYGRLLKDILAEVQQNVREELEKLTDLHLSSLNLTAKHLIFEE